MIKITVDSSKKYDVIMKPGILSEAGGCIRAALDLKDAELSDKKVCIVTDAVVNKLYGGESHPLHTSLAEAGFDVYKYVFDGGELNKNMTTISQILEYLAENSFTRSDILIALGGGITGDVTGFAAAAFLRGVDFIQIPTSLLAVVDSSVGGKTGVNLSSGKNLAGAFHQPSLVLFDPDVLSTLSDHLKLDGIAEAIKAGFIADPEIIRLLTSKGRSELLGDTELLTRIASMAVEVKRRIVQEDEREKDSRQLLNLGHTVAHAIEKCSDYTISHGHAVATGMAVISTAAVRMGWCSRQSCDTMIQTLTNAGFSLDCPYSAAQLTEAALKDKKRRGSSLTLVVPHEVGDCRLKPVDIRSVEEIFSAGLAGLK